MELIFDRDELISALNSVIPLIPPKSAFSILQNILIRIESGKVIIAGSDLDVFIEKTLTAEIAQGEKEKVLLPGKKLLAIAKEIEVDRINLRIAEQVATVLGIRSNFTFPTIDPAEYPEIPKFPDGASFEINWPDLWKLIKAVSFVASKDYSKGAMSGILFTSSGDALRIVTTDGVKLGFIEKRERFGPEFSLIIPPKAFDLISGYSGMVTFGLESGDSPKLFGIKGEDIQITGRLIQGPFPAYEGVIPKEFVGELKVSKKNFESTLRRVSLFANTTTKAVYLDLAPGLINMNISTPNVGAAREEIEAEYEGEELKIGFNASFMIDILRHIDSDRIKIGFTSPASAMKIEPEEKGDIEVFYLLMPVRMG
ncbi:DNA polymerase III subunit beta [candidate division WOR-3 bacterium]|uniref:Beta sliding clamp n=1 Tax=candidate division WOR-3 bacterium TaxID=2052148 RepID=A0A660SNZ1_UNCW3|nr:MAG: DNA polymerase III subunit beta [candidate division WOR-3 bacterium]